jgi:hypothetical protein
VSKSEAELVDEDGEEVKKQVADEIGSLEPEEDVKSTTSSKKRKRSEY